MVTSIMIVGVGGQGSLLASKLLGRAAMDKGYDVKVSEVHGMSQRGGSVVTYVKFGDKVNSPIIDKGEADYIISFELLEAARYVQFLKPGAEYPSELIAKMEAAGAKVDAIDALTIAEQAGSSKATNIVLMGVFSKYIKEISKEEWVKAVEASVPAKFLELNMKAFEMGLAAE